MDLDVARKALSKRSAFSSKRVAFFAVTGLCLVAGVFLHAGHYFGRQVVEQIAPAAVPPPPAAAPAAEATKSVPQTPPAAPATEATKSVPQETGALPKEQADQTGAAAGQGEPAGEAVESAEQPQPSGSGMILVSRQPVAVLASPSSSAPVLYGFPAGRPFRLIGRDGRFAHIQDLRSSASGWIDEAALAPPPRVPAAPAASRPSQPKPAAVSRKPANASADQKPNAAKKDSQVKESQIPNDSEPATQSDRGPSGLFGRGGLFGGIFGGGN